MAANAFGDAFAILVPAPSLGLDRVDILPLNGSIVTSELGEPAFVAGLQPYKPFYAAIETPESEPDLRPEPKSIELLPTYRSITVIEVRAAPSLAVRGRLIDAKGRPIANITGDLLDSKGVKKALAGTFTDAEGIFECYDLDFGEHAIRWGDGSKSVFEIAQDETGKLIELGDIRCAASDAAEGSRP